MWGSQQRGRSASGLQPSWWAEGIRTGCGRQADVAACAGRKDAGTATSHCWTRGDGSANMVLPVESSAPCLLCLRHDHRHRHRAWLLWLHANKQQGCVQCKHGGMQHKHPASTGRLCWNPLAPGRVQPQEYSGTGPGTTTAKVMFGGSMGGCEPVPGVLVPAS